MNVKQLKELLEPLPDDAAVTFHSYYKGCGLRQYSVEDTWTYPKGAAPADVKCFVINPGSVYDGRRCLPRLVSRVEKAFGYTEKIKDALREREI